VKWSPSISEFASAHQISAKWDTFWLWCGALTISKIKIAAACHLGYSKFLVYVTWPFSACYSASYCKKRLKSDDRLLSYVQKRFQRWRPSAILNFTFNFWSHRPICPGFNIRCMYQISSKSDDFSLRWRFSDFQNGGRPPFWILKICNVLERGLCWHAVLLLVQNLAEIGQSVDELWPKKWFSRWRPPQPNYLVSSSTPLGHGCNIWLSRPNGVGLLEETKWFLLF